MSEFKNFRTELQNHINSMMKNHDMFYQVNIDKEVIWNTYLDSFPAGSNEIFRERREYDCAACRSFIKHFGHVVAINDDNDVISIWDFSTTVDIFKPVALAMSQLVHSSIVNENFLSEERRIGIPSNMEKTEVEIITWNHYYIDLMTKFVNVTKKSLGDIKGSFNDKRGVLKRTLNELTDESFEVVLDLVSQNSLYKGSEWKSVLTKILAIKKEYAKVEDSKKDLFCWRMAAKLNDVGAKLRNHSIGTLLIDLSEGMDVEEAVRKYEAVVAPTSYKRPKAIFTKGMVEQAEKKIIELGFQDSLARRFAHIDDITVNNILFANRDVLKKMSNGLLGDLIQQAKKPGKQYSKTEEIGIDDFIENVLPRVQNISVLLENKHSQNFVSLIAPVNKNSKSMFKWDNGFCWAYNGNIADSMIRENVKNAGGAVDGVLRFSIQWNDGSDYNQNDFDAHCTLPGGAFIAYNRMVDHKTHGELDVDIRIPHAGKAAVENITWPDKSKMTPGVYKFYVHNFAYRGGRSGFKAEIEFDGEIHSFEYDAELRQNENVYVAEVALNKDGKFSIKPLLGSQISSREVWGLKSNEFHPVSVMMHSPNYWDEQQGIGNKHYFFMLKGCENDSAPNGFFNEFLNNSLLEHKRVFEALGGKMKVQDSEDQLSGLGFSSTKRNSVVLKLEGAINRMVKVVF